MIPAFIKEAAAFSLGVNDGSNNPVDWGCLCSVASPVLSVTFLDVGQGLAVVIEDPSGMVIMATGRRTAFQEQTGRIGENILLPC